MLSHFSHVQSPVDCSPPGSSVHGTLQARILEWVGILLGIFPTQGPNMGLPHCGQILYPLSHLRSSGSQNSLLAWPMSPGGRAPQFRTTGLREREGTQCLVGLQTQVTCLELKDVGVGMFLASISDLAASTDAARRGGGGQGCPRRRTHMEGLGDPGRHHRILAVQPTVLSSAHSLQRRGLTRTRDQVNRHPEVCAAAAL